MTPDRGGAKIWQSTVIKASKLALEYENSTAMNQLNFTSFFLFLSAVQPNVFIDKL